MKNVKRNLVVSLFSFLMFLMMNIELSGMSGCTADDPGECVSACSTGTPCCVGYSPNCTEGIDKRWIDCGDGHMSCPIDVE